jgi:starch synthase
VVADGVTGLLVPYDPERATDAAYVADFEAQFATRINELTRDPARAAAMGVAGRQRCIDEFSWAQIAAETVEVYRAAIARHGARSAT